MYFLYRCYHFILKCIVIFIGIPDPRLYQGYSGFKQWLALLNPNKPVLVVTDNTLKNLGVVAPILALLESLGSCLVTLMLIQRLAMLKAV